jgi:hypothetical protein
VGEKVPVVTQQVRTLNDEFLALADAVAFLGAVSGGAFGQMAMDLANVMAAGQAGDQARASWDAASGATGKTAAGIGIIAGGYAAIDNATSTRGKGTNALKGAAAGAMYGSAIMPGWGTAIGAGVGAVYGWWKGGKDERKTNDMRDELMAASGGFDELNKKAFLAGTTIKDVLDAKYPEQFEAAVSNLNAAFDFQAIALAAVDETAKKYGFTLEELGPALQRQELDQQAQELFKDWEVLNAAGIDTIAIQTRMSESVSEYLQTAIRMGAEIPAAMQPMLEDMAKAGQLTDANGDKIEDLEGAGVKWSLTMSEGFTKLIDAVTKLSEVISKNLGTSLDNTHAKINAIPKYVDVNVAYHEQNRPAPVATEALEGYQHGTDGFRNFGAGTPVMLHGWEAVVPREGASTAGAALGGAEGGATIVVNAQGAFFDTPGSLQQLADRVEAALSARHGLKNKRRAA